MAKPLKDTEPAPQPLFPTKQAPSALAEESGLSRFEPALKLMLENQVKGTLDQDTFPYTKPQLDADGLAAQENLSQASLRSAKPTWARTRPSANEPRQRIIVFMAGGATYAESRACYEVSRSSSKDVVLTTSHMLTPSLFLRQVGDLSVDKRRLDIPAERPPKKAPAHLFEREPAPTPVPPPQQQKPQPQPPTAALKSMNLNNRPPNTNGGPPPSAGPTQPASSSGKLGKKEKDPDKKKKHHFFGSKKS